MGFPDRTTSQFCGIQRNMLYDEPDLVDEIIQHMVDMTCEIIERTLPLIKGKIRIGHFWEDICFRSVPMISPAYFGKHIVPRYRQIVDVIIAYCIDSIIVDCDGRKGPLIRVWLDAGINILLPLERIFDTDPVMLRKQYGHDLLLMGGVDKKKIALGGDEIMRELEYLAPLVEEGGYIPHCDHLCPSDVTLENYRFYLMKKREIFGIPKKEERIRKSPDGL